MCYGQREGLTCPSVDVVIIYFVFSISSSMLTDFCLEMFHQRASQILPNQWKYFLRQTRNASQQLETITKSKQSKTNEELIAPVRHLFENQCTVIVSPSTNIYRNLALEEWIYRNYDFSSSDKQQQHLLLLWRNEPAVVVGRHQNIWSEVNLNFCRQNQTSIVRRNSGGGAVYHDQQNLNISFMTSKRGYNRKRNLAFLAEILRTNYAIETIISEREDLVIKDTGEKVSGTASKLNGHNSYHHCTLLVDVDRHRLRHSLRATKLTKPGVISLESNATKSVPSPILNLKSLNPQISIESLINDIGRAFNSNQFIAPTPDGATSNIFTLTEADIAHKFHDLDAIQSQFESWHWIYSKTPKYSLVTRVLLPETGDDHNRLCITIEKGSIVSITLDNCVELTTLLAEAFVGTRWHESDVLRSIQNFQSLAMSTTDTADRLSLALLSCYKFTVD